MWHQITNKHWKSIGAEFFWAQEALILPQIPVWSRRLAAEQ